MKNDSGILIQNMDQMEKDLAGDDQLEIVNNKVNEMKLGSDGRGKRKHFQYLHFLFCIY